MATDDMEPEENGHGEHTGKVLLLAKSAVHSEMATVKRFQILGAAVVTIFLAGVFVVLFLNSHYADAKAFEALEGKHDSTQKTLQDHIVNETSQISALKSTTDRSHEDFEYVRDQVGEIAKSMRGVRVLPRPVHPAIRSPDGETP